MTMNNEYAPIIRKENVVNKFFCWWILPQFSMVYLALDFNSKRITTNYLLLLQIIKFIKKYMQSF